MSTVEVLRAARELYAAKPSHAPVGQSPRPGTHCVVYAVSRQTDAGAHHALGAFALAIETTEIVEWNATHSTAEVLAAFDRAIANEEAKQQEFDVTEHDSALFRIGEPHHPERVEA